MDDAAGFGNEKSIEIFPQIFDFVPPGNPMNFQERRCGFGVVGFNLKPDVGMTEVWHFINPQTIWPELKNASVRFFLDSRQRQRVAIKRDRLFVSVSRTFDRNIGAARKSRSVKLRRSEEHTSELQSRFGI